MTRLPDRLKKVLRVSLRVYRITAYVVFAPFLFLVTWLFVSPVIEFSAASVVLPNGMVLKHRFNLNRGARDDLFAAGGRTRVARDIGLVCFNDRYLLTTTLYGNSPTLFDGKTGRRVDDADYDAALAASGLGRRRGIACDGYYTIMVEAGDLFHPARELPCLWRNTENKSLRNRAWLDRPCYRPQ